MKYLQMLFYILVLSAVVSGIMGYFLRPKKTPLPPLDVIEQRETAFIQWLTILYRDNPSAKEAVLTNMPYILDDNERVGQFDADFVLLSLEVAEVLDKAYLTSIYWDVSWKSDSLPELNDSLLPLCQRFGFVPEWQNFREDDFYREGDELLIQPILRWLAAEFLAHGAILYANDTFSETRLLFAVPIDDNADFQVACTQWGLTID